MEDGPRHSSHSRGSVVVIGILLTLVLVVVVVRTTGSSSGLAPLDEEPLETPVVDSVGPGDTYVRTTRVFRRYGPLSEDPKFLEEAGPPTQIEVVSTVFDDEGCASRIVATRSTTGGVLLDERTTESEEGTSVSFGSGEAICLEQLRERRREQLQDIGDYADAELHDNGGPLLSVITSAPTRTFTESDVPYAADLDVVSTTFQFFIRRATMTVESFEYRAILGDGTSVLLERREVTAEEIERS